MSKTAFRTIMMIVLAILFGMIFIFALKHALTKILS